MPIPPSPTRFPWRWVRPGDEEIARKLGFHPLPFPTQPEGEKDLGPPIAATFPVSPVMPPGFREGLQGAPVMPPPASQPVPSKPSLARQVWRWAGRNAPPSGERQIDVFGFGAAGQAASDVPLRFSRSLGAALAGREEDIPGILIGEKPGVAVSEALKSRLGPELWKDISTAPFRGPFSPASDVSLVGEAVGDVVTSLFIDMITDPVNFVSMGGTQALGKVGAKIERTLNRGLTFGERRQLSGLLESYQGLTPELRKQILRHGVQGAGQGAIKPKVPVTPGVTKSFEVTITKGTIKPKGGVEAPFERTFTVQAKTPQAAIKSIRDTGIAADKIAVREVTKPISPFKNPPGRHEVLSFEEMGPEAFEPIKGGFVAPTVKGDVGQAVRAGLKQAAKTGKDVYAFPTGDGMKLGNNPPPFGVQHIILRPDGTHLVVPFTPGTSIGLSKAELIAKRDELVAKIPRQETGKELLHPEEVGKLRDEMADLDAQIRGISKTEGEVAPKAPVTPEVLPPGLKKSIVSLSDKELTKRVKLASPHQKLYQAEINRRATIPQAEAVRPAVPKVAAVSRDDLLVMAREYNSPETFIKAIQTELGVYDRQGRHIPMGQGKTTPLGQSLGEAITKEGPGKGWFGVASNLWKEANPGRVPPSLAELLAKEISPAEMEAVMNLRRQAGLQGPSLGLRAEPPIQPQKITPPEIPPEAKVGAPPSGQAPPPPTTTFHDEVLEQIKAQREAITARRQTGQKITPKRMIGAKGAVPLGPQGIPLERALAVRENILPATTSPAKIFTLGPTPRAGLPAFAYFKQPTEELLRIAKSEGIQIDMIKYAMGEASTLSPELNALSARLHSLRAVIDPIKRFSPDVVDSYLLSSRIAQAEKLRIQAGATGIGRMLVELLGETTGKLALQGKRIPELASLFKGRVVPSQEPYIGTVRHVLEHSEKYNLPVIWRHFVHEWDAIHDSNLAILVKRLGVKSGEVRDVYVTQSVVQPKGGGLFGGRPLGKPGFTRPRELNADQFYAWAAGEGLQVKTDLLDLFVSRMAAAAKLKADITFLDALALKTGGKRLAPGIKPGMGEGVITQRGISWLFADNVAAEAKLVLTPMVDDEAAVNLIVNNMRALILQFDLSLMGMRQGILALTANPVGTLQGYAKMWQVLRSPEAYATWLAQNTERTMFYSQRGAKFNVSPLELPTRALGGTPSLVEYIPGVEWINNIQFNIAMPILKLSLIERNLATLRAIQSSKGLAGLAHKIPGLGNVAKRLGGKLFSMTEDEVVKAAIDAAQNHLGGVESARYTTGRLSALRNLLVFTENFTRAQMGIAINLPKFSPQGILARRMLMQEMLFAVGVAAVVGTITGKGFTLDPRSRLFGKVWIPGVGYVSFLPHAALIRTLSRSIGGIPEEEFGAEDNWISQRAKTLWNWSDGRAGQVPHLVSDFIRGTDFAGRQISNKAMYILNEIAPIPAQTLADSYRRSKDVLSLGATAVIAFLGADITPQSARDKLADLSGVDNLSDLEPKQRIQLEMTPGARAIRKQGGATVAQRRRELAYDYYDGQLARDMLRAQGKISKDQWRGSYYKEKAKFAAQREGWDKAFGMDFPLSKKPESQALEGYYNLFEVYTDPATKLFDDSGFERAEAEYLSTLPAELRDYISRNVNPYATPTAERFEMAKKQLLRTYWDLDKAFLQTLPETKREMWFDYIQLKQQNPDKAAQERKKTSVIRQMESAFDRYKLQWRGKNQEADDALVEWYGLIPAKEQLKPAPRIPPKIPEWMLK